MADLQDFDALPRVDGFSLDKAKSGCVHRIDGFKLEQMPLEHVEGMALELGDGGGKGRLLFSLGHLLLLFHLALAVTSLKGPQRIFEPGLVRPQLARLNMIFGRIPAICEQKITYKSKEVKKTRYLVVTSLIFP